MNFQDSSVFDSPRYLVHRHAQRQLREKNGIKIASDKEDTVPFGYERMNSFCLPPIQGRGYTIQIEQEIKTSFGDNNLTTTQKFMGLAARFKLPENALHSVYPPQGHEEPTTTLPSVVFTDPSFPWERPGSEKSDELANQPDDYVRNRTPWIALFVFTEDEIKVPAANLKEIFPIDPNHKGDVTQSPTFSIPIDTLNMKHIRKTVTPLTVEENDRSDDSKTTDIILVQKPLFQALFSKYEKAGEVSLNANSPYVYNHRYLAHKRVVNTRGMALSYLQSSEGESGSFGVVYSHRAGPTNIKVPTPVYAHLVSIERVEQLKPWPLANDIEYVAMVSLHSWSYICLPPGTRTVYDDFVDLGRSITYLAPKLSNEAKSKLLNRPGVGPKLLERMQNGYTLQRYRTKTGEVTSCFMRGPLVPKKVQLPSWWNAFSMTGHDLNILDQDLGIMDISYSAAWNLGKTMAIADQAFTTALVRVRGQVVVPAKNEAQAQYAHSYGIYTSREELLKSLDQSLERLGSLHLATSQSRDVLKQRWQRPGKTSLDLSFHGKAVDASIEKHLENNAFRVAGGYQIEDGNRQDEVVHLYDEYNIPNSPDWVVVMRWLLDRMNLHGIPAHYLLTDASHLPLESMRFFNIDDSWMASFLDGALSLGNHLSQQQDDVRNNIKKAFKKYLSSPTSIHEHPPPIPRFGCFIRSGLIRKFPDLQIAVDPPESLEGQPILIRHTIMDDGLMLCLFSEPPSATRFKRLRFTQPPHQQTFEAGTNLTDTSLKMAYSRTFTHIAKPSDTENTDPIDWLECKRNQPDIDRGVIFLWDSPSIGGQPPVPLNCLLMDNLAADYLLKLNTALAKPAPKDPNQNPEDVSYFADTAPTAALMGFQQSSKSCSLHIDMLEAVCNDITNFKDDRSRVNINLEIWARLPTYIFRFWSSNQPGTIEDPGSIPTLSGEDAEGTVVSLQQDIVFSINLEDKKPGLYYVEYIQIRIPVGPPPKDQLSPLPFLKGNLTGVDSRARATMLSNLRFNPRVSYTKDNKLEIILLPRGHFQLPTGPDNPTKPNEPKSKLPVVPVSSCREVSFMLSNIKVHLLPKNVAELRVFPEIVVSYGGHPAQGVTSPETYMRIRTPPQTQEPKSDW
ncbi:hypothetical protein B0J11DRAFT_498824 [Dendryphion nanum]|uniref:Uncharacterized protein n=1 Tax=Dendryphion nanum TaxID=256645 RepID=A0A9P9I8G6_9PLEO|nr:hypothetical protein B0J11DRAFT_498824 [Dendryphion nanum]